MKKCFLIKSLLLTAAALLLTACTSSGTDENITDEIHTDTQTEIEQIPDFGETENRPMPLPEQTEEWHAIGGDAEKMYPIGTIGEYDDESLDKWIVLLGSDEDNTVFFDSWKKAGDALGLDLSILSSDLSTVGYHKHLAEEVGASDDYEILQSVMPSVNDSSDVPVQTNEEYSKTVKEYSLAPEIKCASVFISKNSSESKNPEKYRENFRSLGGETAYRENQSLRSGRVILKEAAIEERNIIFYCQPLEAEGNESEPNEEVSLCADITSDNCLIEISFGTIIRSEAENAAEKMYKLLSESVN